jgi:hypothetical protein
MTTQKLVETYRAALRFSREGRLKPPKSHETIDRLYAELRRLADAGDATAQDVVYRTSNCRSSF